MTTLYDRKGRLKKDGFVLNLHVMRLSNRSGSRSWTLGDHSYPKLRFKSVAIMTRLKNNLHQGCTNSEQRFTRGTTFFFASTPNNICGSPVWNCFMSQFLRLELYGVSYIFLKKTGALLAYVTTENTVLGWN